MSKTDKVAVTIDHKVLQAAERLRHQTGESRSALVTRALRLLVSDESHTERVRDYVKGYQAQPETKQEIELATQMAANVLKDLEW